MSQRTPPRIWTVRRKLIANLLPLAVGLPFCMAALLLRGWATFTLLGLGIAAAIVSLNWLGMAGNEAMRQELIQLLNPPEHAVYVGVARPEFRDALDPHEDIGFLLMEPGRLVFKGETLSLELGRDPKLGICYGFNPHSVLGLGRWVRIEGVSSGGCPVLLIEPREHHTIRGNRRLGSQLRAELEKWRDK